MKNRPLALLLVGLLVANAVNAQTATRLRGTITAIDGNVMSVKSRDGKDVKVQVPDNVSVAVATAIRFADIKQGDYLGATTVAAADGSLTAIEVHYLPPTVPEGHGPMGSATGLDDDQRERQLDRCGSRSSRAHVAIQRRHEEDERA